MPLALGIEKNLVTDLPVELVASYSAINHVLLNCGNSTIGVQVLPSLAIKRNWQPDVINALSKFTTDVSQLLQCRGVTFYRNGFVTYDNMWHVYIRFNRLIVKFNRPTLLRKVN